MGNFMRYGNDSLENGTWTLSRIENPIVLYGNYDTGLPKGQWNFFLTDEVKWDSNWMRYENRQTSSKFAVPFNWEEQLIDSNLYRLKASNETIGEIDLVIGVKSGSLTPNEVSSLGRDVDAGLLDQGFTFTSKKDTLVQPAGTYYFNKFSLTNKQSQSVTLYNVYGHTKSGKFFVEISMYHAGPNIELTSVIFSLIANHFYVAGDRFYSPFK